MNAIHPWVLAYSGSKTKSAKRMSVACKGERYVQAKKKPKGITAIVKIMFAMLLKFFHFGFSGRF
jgi:hypothetical protein